MNTQKKTLRWLILAALLFHLGVFAALWSRFQRRSELVNTAGRLTVRRNDRLRERVSPQITRRLYPFSIVPGGIQDLAELKSAVLKDEVVSGHFADFDVSKARFEEVQTDKNVFVSYRVKNKVYWTNKKVRLAKGEKLISDGTNLARARCGNRISEVARAPVLAEEPDPAVLDTPTVSEKSLAALPLLLPSGSTGGTASPVPVSSVAAARNGSGSKWIIPGLLGGAGGFVAGRGSRPSIASVPEPATFLLMGSALGCYVLFKKRFSK